MALQLFSDGDSLRLLVGYESGQVVLFAFKGSPEAAWTPPGPGTYREEGQGWEVLWIEQGHRETGW